MKSDKSRVSEEKTYNLSNQDEGKHGALDWNHPRREKCVLHTASCQFVLIVRTINALTKYHISKELTSHIIDHYH